MYIIIGILFITCLIGAATYYGGILEYNNYLNKMSEKYTFEEIDGKISDVQKVLDENELKGDIFERLLDYLEFWKSVKKNKEKLNQENYEDIIS